MDGALQRRATTASLRPEPHPDTAVVDLDVVGSRRPHGRHRERSTRADIKLCAVSGAGDLVVPQFAVGKRAAVVGADVVDGVEHAADVKQRDHVVIDLDEGLARIGDLGNVGHSDELSHRLHSSGSSHMTGLEPAGHARGVAAPSPRPPQLTRRIRLPIARASASRTCGIVIRSKTC